MHEIIIIIKKRRKQVGVSIVVVVIITAVKQWVSQIVDLSDVYSPHGYFVLQRQRSR